MSTLRKDIPTSKKAAKAYIKSWLKFSFVKDVFIRGSRSLKTKNEPRRFCDWDIEIITDGRSVMFSHPRKFGILHADIYFLTEPTEMASHWKEVIK